MNLKTKVSFILEQAFIQAREDGTTKTGETKIYDKSNLKVYIQIF